MGKSPEMQVGGFVWTFTRMLVLVVKNAPANAEDRRGAGSVPGLGRFPGGGNGNPFLYSCLENPHQQMSPAGYSSQGWKESDLSEATEQARTD